MSASIALPVLGILLLMAAPVASQSTDTGVTEKTDGPVKGGAALPAGWSARPDGDGDVNDIKFVIMEPGYHLTLGPATILYREQDRVDGPFHILATFHQMKKLEHAEGYGLFFGGKALTETGQRYTYFLVRDDGTYLVKRRDGEKMTEITKGWIAHPTVKKSDAKGRTSNLLEIDAKQNPQQVEFKVNGKTVYRADARSLDLKGIVGLRANHNLDIHVEGLAVHR
jgi:hypothetical protein